MPMKSVSHEKFGGGIMSDIDFKLYVDGEENPKDDRVKITMSSNFLPYTKWEASPISAISSKIRVWPAGQIGSCLLMNEFLQKHMKD